MFLSACASFFKTQDLSFYLYKRHVRSKFVYHIKSAAVDVFIGEIIEQVVP